MTHWISYSLHDVESQPPQAEAAGVAPTGYVLHSNAEAADVLQLAAMSLMSVQERCRVPSGFQLCALKVGMHPKAVMSDLAAAAQADDIFSDG